MAEESDYSRTEPPSERRLALARAEGSVPRSTELSSLLVVGVMVGSLAIWGAHLFDRLRQLFSEHFRQVAQSFPGSAYGFLQQSAMEILPFLIALFLAALLAPLLLSGWIFAPRVVQFRGERLNPFISTSRMFAANGLVDGFKGGVKVLAFALLSFSFYRANLDGFAGLSAMPLQQAVAAFGGLLIKGMLILLGAMVLVTLIDASWQWWRYLRSLAMSHAEVMAEAREAEGSPELKARIRARQNAMRQKVAE
jgi:flagellar biosynthetic protein FlhB